MFAADQVLHHRYRLQHPLNISAGRQTWVAEETEASRSVVIKLLEFGGSMRWEELKLFEREAQVLQQLEHTRIPQYYDYFSVQGSDLWFGLVQEHISGHSLKQCLQLGQQFPPALVQDLAQQSLEILGYLHQRRPPVLHRDIKPSNLIWDEAGDLYLIDFGAVQSRPREAGASFTVVGTYGYTPLEQFGGQAVPASDLYALGATLVHLMTGIAPADLPQPNLQLQFRDRLNPDVSPQFIHWLEQLIAPSLERRFQTTQQAISALLALDTSHPVSDTSPSAIALNSTSPPTPTSPPIGSAIEIQKAPHQLTVLIPSRLEATLLLPLRTRLQQGLQWVGQQLGQIQEQFQAQSPTQQRETYILGGLLGIGLVILNAYVPVVVTVLSWVLSGLFVVPVLLIPGGIVALVILSILLSQTGLDYSERTSIRFDRHYFEIVRRSLLKSKQSQWGDAAQIQEIVVNTDFLFNRHRHPHICIKLGGKRARLFSRTKTARFGHQLSLAELNWLVEEIKTWCVDQVQEPPPDPWT